MAKAITYRTGTRARDLRTVLVDEVRTVVVVAPERLELLTGKLLHGTTCAHSFWDAELGTSGDDFAVPASQVTQVREMQIAVKARHK